MPGILCVLFGNLASKRHSYEVYCTIFSKVYDSRNSEIVSQSLIKPYF